MGWLQNLFRRNPTATWRDAGAAIVVDVTRCTVQGHGFCARSADFAPLGPAQAWPAKNGCGSLTYPDKGVQLDFEFDQFTGAVVMLRNPPYARPDASRPFNGKLMRHGVPLGFGAGANSAEIIRLLGEPESREEDEDESILIYRFDNVVIEFEVAVPDGLYVINTYFEGEVQTP